MRELAGTWSLPPLGAEEIGPYGDFPRLTDGEKQELWRSYRDGCHPRVPVTLGVNNRVLLQAPELNTACWTYRDVFTKPEAMLAVQLRTEHLLRSRFGLFSDSATGLPEQWRVSPHFQNVGEAAQLGCPLQFRPGEVPDTIPAYAGARGRAVFDVEVDRVAERGFIADGLRFTHRMEEAARGATFLGRPIAVQPFALLCSDGPMTVAMNLRGPEILTDLIDDPGYAAELFDFIVTAAIKRNRALHEYWDIADRPEDEAWLADDSISLLSVEQYRSAVLPWHRKWYDAMDPDHRRKRNIHLCGDAQRHFVTIHEELGVTNFDTGFPIDFTRLRSELGDDVEVQGGVEVSTLLGASPQAVYSRAETILRSGILRGGRFVLREANNLPPRTPWRNLAAMYRAAFSFGKVG